MRKPSLFIKMAVVLSLVVGLLSGCGSPSNALIQNYPLESVNKNGNSSSYVYRAAGETVPEVAADLAAQRQPEQMSAEDTEHMFLVYRDEYYHLQKDPNQPDDTLIEVDSESYVRQNYDSSFLEGYLTAQLIGSLFNGLGGYGGGYRGYTSRDIYEPQQSYHTPTPAEKKMAPPLTVEKQGSVKRRGSPAGGGTGGFFGGGESGGGTDSPGSRGSIQRTPDGRSGSDSGGYTKPRTSIKKPSTRTRRGGIYRRR